MYIIEVVVEEFGVSGDFSGEYKLVASSKIGSWIGREYQAEASDRKFTINVISRVEDSGIELGCCIVRHRSEHEFTEEAVCKYARGFLACIKHELSCNKV